MRGKKQFKTMKYKYVWKDHTFVRLVKQGEKIKVSQWEEFESSCDPKLFRTYFVRLWENTNVAKEDIMTEDVINTSDIAKKYFEKFWKEPDKRRWPKTILQKLQS